MTEERLKAAVASVRAEIEAYAAMIEHLAVTEVGRPTTVLRNLLGYARRASTMLSRLGIDVSLELRHEFDALIEDTHDDDGDPRPDPHRVAPDQNEAFLAAHRANVAALTAAADAAEAA